MTPLRRVLLLEVRGRDLLDDEAVEGVLPNARDVIEDGELIAEGRPRLRVARAREREAETGAEPPAPAGAALLSERGVGSTFAIAFDAVEDLASKAAAR